MNGSVSRHCDQGEGRVANTAIAALGEQQVIVGTSRVSCFMIETSFSSLILTNLTGKTWPVGLEVRSGLQRLGAKIRRLCRRSQGDLHSAWQ